nr:sulfatase-like hydrolase/transferase [Rhodopirellula sp. SM50]
MKNFLYLLPFLSLVTTAVAADPAPPNVVLILSDDQGYTDYGFMGHPEIETPNLDQLARESALFRRGYVPTALCRPSLMTLITGLYSHQNKTTGNDPANTLANKVHSEKAGKDARELLISHIDKTGALPQWLTKQGYVSHQSGKWWEGSYPVSKEPKFLKSHVSLPAHFAASGYKTLTAGKVFHGGTVIQKHFQVVGPRLGQWLKGLDQKVYDKPKQWHGIWDFGPQDYDETKFTDRVTATWVTEQLKSKHDKPFLLAFGFYRPHVPFFPPRRVYDRFEDVQLPRVDDDDWSDIPDAARKVSLSNEKIPTHDWMRKNGRWEEAVHAYLACIRWTDEQLGRVLDALDNGPHAANTIVVLFSDHGYHLGEKQRWSKFSLWERTTRVPLIISVPDGVSRAADETVPVVDEVTSPRGKGLVTSSTTAGIFRKPTRPSGAINLRNEVPNDLQTIENAPRPRVARHDHRFGCRA